MKFAILKDEKVVNIIVASVNHMRTRKMLNHKYTRIKDDQIAQIGWNYTNGKFVDPATLVVHTVESVSKREPVVPKAPSANKKAESEGSAIEGAINLPSFSNFIAAYLAEKDGNPLPMSEILKQYVLSKRVK